MPYMKLRCCVLSQQSLALSHDAPLGLHAAQLPPRQTSVPQHCAPAPQLALRVVQHVPASHAIVQQSVPSRHAARSARHALGRHWLPVQRNPLQHSVDDWHPTPSVPHAHTPAAHRRPSQQSLITPQPPPSGTQPRRQTPETQRRPTQQSLSFVHTPPSSRHVALHVPSGQPRPAQHCALVVQGLAAATHMSAVHMPPLHCPSPQQPSAAVQVWPIARHAEVGPHFPSTHALLQHSLATLQRSPSGRQPGVHALSTQWLPGQQSFDVAHSPFCTGLQRHCPNTQPNEQHSALLEHAAPTPWQPAAGRCLQLAAHSPSSKTSPARVTSHLRPAASPRGRAAPTTTSPPPSSRTRCESPPAPRTAPPSR